MQQMYLRWWRDECPDDDYSNSNNNYNDSDNDDSLSRDADIPAMSGRDADAVRVRQLAGDRGSSTSSDGSHCSRTTSRPLCLIVALVYALSMYYRFDATFTRGDTL